MSYILHIRTISTYLAVAKQELLTKPTMKNQGGINRGLNEEKSFTNTPSRTSATFRLTALQTEGCKPAALTSAPAFAFNPNPCQ